ncbi:MAG: Gfo/Idh/MocA family oxidoreductase [Actinomycetota bacterium]|nr:Gfo/Idh/MocA family oxidoreductase [Actinomycetota bacterium]
MKGTKVAVVGLGYWGPNLLRNLVTLRGPECVVVVERSLERIAAVATQYPSITCSTSLDQVLDDEDVGAVVLATPVATHAELALAALDAGRHVLVEKPLAASVTDAVAVVERAEKHQRVLMVGHTFLFSPRVELMAQYLAEGRLGRVQYATSSRLNLGLHQRDVGVIWDLASHDFSILFHLLGEFPVSVQTAGRGMVRRDNLDVAFITLTFPSGILASVDVSWLAPRKVRNTVVVGNRQMMVYDDLDNEGPIKIYDKGVVIPDPENFGEHQLTYRHGDILAPFVPPREPLAQELAHFLDCIGGEAPRPCRSDGHFGLRVVEALEAAERSWRQGGRPVAVEARRPGTSRGDLVRR